MRFRVNHPGASVHGQEFEVVEKPSFNEIEYVERLTKVKSDDWSGNLTTRALLWLSIRRVDHTLVSWEGMGELSANDFEDIEGDEAADPTSPSVEG